MSSGRPALWTRLDIFRRTHGPRPQHMLKIGSSVMDVLFPNANEDVFATSPRSQGLFGR